MDDIHDLPALALAWHRNGRAVAIATVVQTWGSAPRPVGSQLIIDGDGGMEGSVSGGCVEGAVIVEALEALSDGTPRVLEFGVSDDEAFAVGLACGGEIKILIEPVGTALPLPVVEKLVAARLQGQPVAYVADLQGGAPQIMQMSAYPERFRLDRSGIEPDGRYFVGVHNPPLRMIIVGAVHIAQFLAPMARSCGFQTVLVDPRSAFGAEQRFPGETIIEYWPDEAILALKPDTRTAIVTLTHDPKLDDPAIMTALRADVFYLGCLGSTRTHAKRITRLQAAGFGTEDIARIHAPVGLDIGGRQPAEIAVSVMAEVITALRAAK
ncbi:XdhC family protein [Yoonia sp. BS5-3]|uniref:XdhC family protein n=1 Tax=Yoonia phaeophyticola TaxID=3137369 RepID=A0ABZ2V314_9RHOB